MFKMGQWREVRVGLVDGGIATASLAARSVLIEKDFRARRRDRGGEGEAGSGHGDAVAKLILEAVPQARLAIARIFGADRTAPVQSVSSALMWMADLNLDVVNCSFGTSDYSAGLEAACRRVSAYGTLLVCSSPARGGLVFPAALDCCIAVTGDARCMAGDLSWLGTETADFGCHPFLVPSDPAQGGGASYAAARVTGLAAELIANGVPREAVVGTLRANCRFVGPEKRGHG